MSISFSDSTLKFYGNDGAVLEMRYDEALDLGGYIIQECPRCGFCLGR